MRLVYSVLKEIELKPEEVRAAQKLTLNKNRALGLNGSYGLYGSDEWINNLKAEIIPRIKIEGVIESVYKVGMYESDEVNSVEIVTSKGGLIHKGIYVNYKKDIPFFKVGKRIEMIFFMEDLKHFDPIIKQYKKHDFVYEVWIEA